MLLISQLSYKSKSPLLANKQGRFHKIVRVPNVRQFQSTGFKFFPALFYYRSGKGLNTIAKFIL